MCGAARRAFLNIALTGVALTAVACGARVADDASWNDPKPGGAEAANAIGELNPGGPSNSPDATPSAIEVSEGSNPSAAAPGNDIVGPSGPAAIGAAPTAPDSAQQLRASSPGVDADGANVDPLPVIGSAPPPPEDRAVAVSVTGESVAKSPLECSIWLDATVDELRETDIVVRSDETAWTADAGCSQEPAWYLWFDSDGTWLRFCPSACEQLKNDPGLVLEVEAIFRAGPSRIVK